MNTLGARVKAARLACGMTQQQLAQAASVTVMTVSNIERGAAENPKLDTMTALAAAMGTTVDALSAKDEAPAEVA